MTGTDLLRELRVSGIAVSTDGYKLRLRAKRGVVTDALRAEIRAAKSELIQLLGSNAPGQSALPCAGGESHADPSDTLGCASGYTQPATCSGCGPVVLRPDAPNWVAFCPWCFRRRAGKPIPRSPAHPYKANDSKHTP